MLNIQEDILHKNPDSSITNQALTKFHKQILNSWLEIKNQDPANRIEILNEYILYNQHIKIRGRMIEKTSNFNIKVDLKIHHLYDYRGRILDQNTLNTKYNQTFTKLQYNSLISAIPQKWKKIYQDDRYKHNR